MSGSFGTSAIGIDKRLLVIEMVSDAAAGERFSRQRGGAALLLSRQAALNKDVQRRGGSHASCLCFHHSNTTRLSVNMGPNQHVDSETAGSVAPPGLLVNTFLLALCGFLTLVFCSSCCSESRDTDG